MASTLYTTLAASWDQAVGTGVTNAVQQAIQGNAVYFASLMLLFIVVTGFLAMFSKMTIQLWVFCAVRASIISILMTAEGFARWIQRPLMEDIPNWIASAMSSGLGAKTGPQQFDAIRDAIFAQQALVLQQATGWWYLAEQIEAGMLAWALSLENALAFVIWIVYRAMIGVLVVTAPFLLGFYLFQTTRPIVTALAGSVVSVLLTMVMVSVVLNIAVGADLAFLRQMVAGPTAGERLMAMVDASMFFLVGMFMTCLVPFVAAKIGNGVAPAVDAMATAPLGPLGSAGRGVANAARRIRGRK